MSKDDENIVRWMKWMQVAPNSVKKLYLKYKADDPWTLYSGNKYGVKDYTIPRGSEGYATMQLLYKQGWKFPNPLEDRDSHFLQLLFDVIENLQKMIGSSDEDKIEFIIDRFVLQSQELQFPFSGMYAHLQQNVQLKNYEGLLSVLELVAMLFKRQVRLS